jgi:hypothetical protein
MSSWPLYEEVSKDNGSKFVSYRCPDPNAVITQEPWFPYSNVCPCDPMLTNPSGRGFSGCPYGIKKEDAPKENLPLSQLINQIPVKSGMEGTLFSSNQFVPPQMNPRQLTRIGQEWRDLN